jgi:hypothetical protein
MKWDLLVRVLPVRPHAAEQLARPVSGTEVGAAAVIEELPFPAGQHLSNHRYIRISVTRLAITDKSGGRRERRQHPLHKFTSLLSPSPAIFVSEF